MKRGDIFSAFAVKKHQQKLRGETDLLEMSELDDEDEMDDEFISEDNEDEDEDEDEGMFVPLGNMRKWLENKPSGFGEGKAYDTFIEDKLQDEIERSRKAQIANVDNLKNNPIQPKDDKMKAYPRSLCENLFRKRVEPGSLQMASAGKNNYNEGQNYHQIYRDVGPWKNLPTDYIKVLEEANDMFGCIHSAEQEGT
ncbi:hypothetical protein OROHE_008328 [Orobanche hederae]